MNTLISLLGCNCPLPTALTTIPANSCPKNIGQIQRLFIVRKGNVIWDDSDPLQNTPSSIAVLGYTIDTVAPWNVLFAAADSTKVVKTPLIGGDSTITAGTAITQGGGDNSTLNGETLINGFNPSDVSMRFDSLDTTQVAAMKELRCEDVEVYFINDAGKILCRKDGDLITGFDAKNFSLSSKNNAGFGTRDNNVLTFQLDDDWDEYLEFKTPSDFNALTI